MMWTLCPLGVAHEYTSIIRCAPWCSRCPRDSSPTATAMLDAFKRLFSGGPHARDWAELSRWAQQQGFGFKRARDDEGFVIDGEFGRRPWRLEWGPPQRSYIAGHELRIRMELQLSSSLQMLLMTRALMESLERETFERYTQSN